MRNSKYSLGNVNLFEYLKRKPKVVSLELTRRCPLDCIYCSIDKEAMNKDLSVQALDDVSENLDLFSRIVVCGIGETFSYKHIDLFFEKFKDKKLSMVTCGVLPIDYAALFSHKNIELIVFSIDSTSEEKIKKISGAYNYNNLIKNLENLVLFREKMKQEGYNFLVSINCVLSQYNLDEIEKIVELAAKYGIKIVSYSFPRGNYEIVEENLEEINRRLFNAFTLCKEYGIFFDSPFDTCCTFMNWINPYINLEGDYFPCSNLFCIGQPAGNVNEEDITSIWEKPEYQKFVKGEFCESCEFLGQEKYKLDEIWSGVKA